MSLLFLLPGTPGVRNGSGFNSSSPVCPPGAQRTAQLTLFLVGRGRTRLGIAGSPRFKTLSLCSQEAPFPLLGSACPLDRTAFSWRRQLCSALGPGLLASRWSEAVAVKKEFLHKD